MPRTPAREVWAKILQAVPAVSLRDLANCNVKVSANQRCLSDCHSMGKAIEHFVRRGGNPDSVVAMHKVEAFSDLMDNIPDRFQSKEKSTRKHRSSPNKHKSSQTENPESQNSYPARISQPMPQIKLMRGLLLLGTLSASEICHASALQQPSTIWVAVSWVAGRSVRFVPSRKSDP